VSPADTGRRPIYSVGARRPYLLWPPPKRWSRRDVLIVALLTSLVAIAHGGIHAETDPFWQARAGLENLEGAPLARRDTWSWAPVPVLFQQNSPGWNSLLGGAVRVLGIYDWGIPGLFALTILSIAALYAVIVVAAWLVGARPMPTLVALGVFSVLGWSTLSARATVPALTLFLSGAVMGYGLSAPRWQISPWVRIGSATSIGLILGVLGIWVHTSWLLLGPVLAIVWAVLWWSSPTLSTPLSVATIAMTGGALFLAPWLGPYGTEIWAYTRRTQEAAAGLSIEWMGLLEVPSQWHWWAMLAICLSTSAAGLAAWRSSRVALLLPLAALSGVIALGSLAAARFLAIALALAVPVGSALLTRIMSADDQARRPAVYFSDPVQRIVWLVVLLLLTPVALVAASPLGRPPGADAVADLPLDCRLFTDPAISNVGLLLRPDLTHYWDGRMDYYGRDRLLQGINFLHLEGPTPAPNGATCVVIRDQRESASANAYRDAMDAEPGWRRAESADGFLMWVAG